MGLRMTGPHIQATGYRKGRDRKRWPANKITFLVVHSAEGATDEISLGNFFRSLGTASSSIGIGQDGGYASYVRYADTPWTNPPIHDDTETVELCGFAAWTREQWLGHAPMLRTLERWLAWRSAVNKIPLRLLSGDQIAAGIKGIVDHDAINDVFGESSHWDVGSNFPWDVVLPNARAIRNGNQTTQGDSDMPLSPEDLGKIKTIVDERVDALQARVNTIAAAQLDQEQARSKALRAKIGALSSAVDTLPEGATKAEIKGLIENIDATVVLKVNEPQPVPAT